MVEGNCGNTEIIIVWKSKILSGEGIRFLTAPGNSLAPILK